MFKIVKKYPLNDTTDFVSVYAPRIAAKAKPGQFIIFRVDETGERIPLTIAGYDRERAPFQSSFRRSVNRPCSWAR